MWQRLSLFVTRVFICSALLCSALVVSSCNEQRRDVATVAPEEYQANLMSSAIYIPDSLGLLHNDFLDVYRLALDSFAVNNTEIIPDSLSNHLTLYANSHIGVTAPTSFVDSLLHFVSNGIDFPSDLPHYIPDYEVRSIMLDILSIVSDTSLTSHQVIDSLYTIRYLVYSREVSSGADSVLRVVASVAHASAIYWFDSSNHSRWQNTRDYFTSQYKPSHGKPFYGYPLKHGREYLEIDAQGAIAGGLTGLIGASGGGPAAILGVLGGAVMGACLSSGVAVTCDFFGISFF